MFFRAISAYANINLNTAEKEMPCQNWFLAILAGMQITNKRTRTSGRTFYRYNVNLRLDIMRLYEYPQGQLDFEAPIWLTEENRKKFIAFMKRLDPECTVVPNVREKDRPPIVGEDKKQWTFEDDFTLLRGVEENLTSEEIGNKLSRKQFSVEFRLANILNPFFAYEEKHGKAGAVEGFLREWYAK